MLLDRIKIKQNRLLTLVEGDITERNVDAIVNPANSYLQHGGGVAGAIVRKGGKLIQKESNEIGFVPVGTSVITTGGNLPCKAVIHTVGPRMGEGNEDEKLRKAINGCLEIGLQYSFKSISVPAISSGIFGFPKDRCAKILVNETICFLEKIDDSPKNIQMVEFCILGDETIRAFLNEFEISKTKYKKNSQY
ncbi:MAG TPA: macro domain-containing protein [Nitrososphaeraceae archaeon]|nr:macro domain-containing protein [Nitrososphaeraceae archaeon]